MRLVLLSLTAWAALHFSTPAYAQEHGSTIHGRAYFDLNGNGVYDAEDVAASGFALEFANGEAIVLILTDVDGLFSFEVTAGIWRGRPVPPPGLSYPEDFTLEISIPQDEPSRVDLEIAIPQGIFQALLVDQPEAPHSSEEPVPGEAHDQPDPSDQPDAPEPQIYDGPIDSTESEMPPQLLPESGSTLRPRIQLMLAFAALLVVGSLMTVLGRRAARS